MFVCVSTCLSVHSHDSKTMQLNFTKYCACCLWLWLGPPLIGLRLCTACFMGDIMFSYHRTNGQTGSALCGLPCGSASWHRLLRPTGRWLGGQACWGAAGCLTARLSCCQDSVVCFAVCFMLVVSCSVGQSQLSMIALSSKCSQCSIKLSIKSTTGYLSTGCLDHHLLPGTWFVPESWYMLLYGFFT